MFRERHQPTVKSVQFSISIGSVQASKSQSVIVKLEQFVRRIEITFAPV